MVTRTDTLLAMVIATCLTSCGLHRELTRFTPSELHEAIQLARVRALAEPGLDPASQSLIGTNRPKLQYYKQAPDFAQYIISWQITSNRLVIVSGDGDLRKLEGAKVRISPDK
jgi:hypothetical protein